MSYSIDAVVARCTRDGVIAWQAVALQCGTSVERAKALYGASALPVRPFSGSCEATSSDPGLKVKILHLLRRQPNITTEDISARLCSPCSSIRKRLSVLAGEGLIAKDRPHHTAGFFGFSWSLTDAGKAFVASSSKQARAA
jgi:hypothetical protein